MGDKNAQFPGFKVRSPEVQLTLHAAKDLITMTVGTTDWQSTRNLKKSLVFKNNLIIVRLQINLLPSDAVVVKKEEEEEEEEEEKEEEQEQEEQEQEQEEQEEEQEEE